MSVVGNSLYENMHAIDGSKLNRTHVIFSANGKKVVHLAKIWFA